MEDVDVDDTEFEEDGTDDDGSNKDCTLCARDAPSDSSCVDRTNAAVADAFAVREANDLIAFYSDQLVWPLSVMGLFVSFSANTKSSRSTPSMHTV